MESYEVQVQQQAGKITCDFESGKTYLNERLEEYRNVVFTEDSKKEAKATVASLRKEKKAFTDRVKEVRDEYMKPLEEFAAKAKELADMYDQPINFINGQVSAFEQRRIEEKKEQIKDLYLECLGDMQAELPLNKIYNSKWENATTNPTQIRREMMERKETVKQGLDAIRQMHSDSEEKAVAMFLESYDLTKSILYINQYEQQKEILAREQERIRREEEERIRREERAKLEAEQREREALARAERDKQEALAAAEAEKLAAVEQAKEEAAQEVIDSMIPQDLEGSSNLYEYRMALTAEAKEKLEMYLTSVGIDWELI